MYLPLTNNPEEVFYISINGILYKFRQLWNEYGFWTLDITDPDDIDLIIGAKLIVGQDILSQFPHIPFGIYADADVDPERDNLDEYEFEVIDIVS